MPKKQREKRAKLEAERAAKARQKKERKLEKELEIKEQKEYKRLINAGVITEDHSKPAVGNISPPSGGVNDSEDESEGSENNQVSVKAPKNKVWTNDKSPQRERVYDFRGGDEAYKRLQQKMREKNRQHHV